MYTPDAVVCAEKSDTAELFDLIQPQSVNDHLKELMPGLTIKVFRTYNASITLATALKNTEGYDELDVPGKKAKVSRTLALAYDRASCASHFFLMLTNSVVRLYAVRCCKQGCGHPVQPPEGCEQGARYADVQASGEKGRAGGRDPGGREEERQLAQVRSLLHTWVAGKRKAAA